MKMNNRKTPFPAHLSAKIWCALFGKLKLFATFEYTYPPSLLSVITYRTSSCDWAKCIQFFTLRYVDL